jgi:Carboxypeptidase regulatory-like domain
VHNIGNSSSTSLNYMEAVMNTRYIPALLACTAMLLASCENNAVDPARELPSDISGNVRLLDNCDAPTADHSGVTVALDGTSFIAVTGPDGTFHFDDVPAGTYSVTIRKAGYVPHEISGLHLQGKGASLTQPLRPLPAWRVHDLDVYTADDSAVELEIEWDHSSLACAARPGQYITFFIGTDPGVSSEHFSMVSTITPRWDSSAPVRVPILSAEMRAHGIAKGTPLYVVAYPTAADPIDVQPVQLVAQSRFVGPGRSDVVRFTAP